MSNPSIINGIPVFNSLEGKPGMCAEVCGGVTVEHPQADFGIFDINATPGPDTGWEIFQLQSVVGAVVTTAVLPFTGRTTGPQRYAVLPSSRFVIDVSATFQDYRNVPAGIFFSSLGFRVFLDSVFSDRYRLLIEGIAGGGFAVDNIAVPPSDGDSLSIRISETSDRIPLLGGNGNYSTTVLVTAEVNGVATVIGPFDTSISCTILHGVTMDFLSVGPVIFGGDFTNYLYESNY